MDFQRYLDRIGFEGKVENCDLETLSKLQLQHFLHVPYENFDALLPGRKIQLDADAVYHKIVACGRGGWCHELNVGFAWLLQSLGFKVTIASAASWNEPAQCLRGDGDHMVLLVDIGEERYLADVGWGSYMATVQPILLKDGHTVQMVNGRFRITKQPSGHEWRLFYKSLDDKNLDEWSELVHQFSERPKTIEDFREICDLYQSGEELSIGILPFLPCVMLWADNGRARHAIAANKYRFYKNSGPGKDPFEKEDQMDGKRMELRLREHFGIEVSLDDLDLEQGLAKAIALSHDTAVEQNCAQPFLEKMHQ